MAQIDVYNRERGVTYVYESFSYWDKELKQPRSKRKLIGKRDADGNLIPTGTKGRKKAEQQPDSPDHSDTDYQRCILLMQEKDETILSLKRQLAAAQTENESLRKAIRQSNNLLEKALQERSARFNG